MATNYKNRVNSVNEEIARYDNTTDSHIRKKVKNLKKKLKKQGLDPKGHPQIKGV